MCTERAGISRTLTSELCDAADSYDEVCNKIGKRPKKKRSDDQCVFIVMVEEPKYYPLKEVSYI